MNQFYTESFCSVPSTEDDPLEAIVRRDARVMLEAALEHEVSEYLERRPHQRAGHATDFRGYRNGDAKERKVTVGSGTIKVQVPRVSDVAEGQAQFESQIVKPYQRRSRTVAEVFPKLFIEGLATRDFEPALRTLMGEEAALSPSTIVRLNTRFKAEYEEWPKSSLSSVPLVYVGCPRFMVQFKLQSSWVESARLETPQAFGNAASHAVAPCCSAAGSWRLKPELP